MLRSYLAILALALGGCGTQAPFVSVVDGLTVLHLPTQRCPTQDAGACFVKVDYVIAYDDEYNKDHEIDHVRGLRHGPWAKLSGRTCAIVIDGGSTNYKAGRQICRASHGYYSG